MIYGDSVDARGLRRGAFTLFENRVVIAMNAIRAAVSFPAFSVGNGSAERTGKLPVLKTNLSSVVMRDTFNGRAGRAKGMIRTAPLYDCGAMTFRRRFGIPERLDATSRNPWVNLRQRP